MGSHKTAEFAFCHVALPDLFRWYFRGFGQNPRRQLLCAHLEAEKTHDPAIFSAFMPFWRDAFAIGFCYVERNVSSK
jgi:hypothetical protein